MSDISTKLTYLNETKTQLKNTINLTGANLTNDTFRSYPSKLYKKLLDTVVDSDTLYNNLPKVNGTGTDITLNNTDECKIKFNMLGGNTEQDSYTGKNLVGLAVGQSAEVSGITLTITNEGYLKLNGTASANINKSYAFVENPSQTYENIQYSLDSFYVSGTTSGNIVVNLRKGSTPSDISGQLNPSLFYINANDKKTTFTPGDTGYVTGIQIIINSGVSLNNFIVKLQLEEGNTMTSYEPYVGGTASPSPDYPQDIKTVKGVENYFNPTIEWLNGNVSCTIENQEITFNGKSSGGATWPTANVNIPAGDYIITLEVLEGTHISGRNLWVDFFNGNSKITNASFKISEKTKTITFNNTINNIKLGYENGDEYINFKFRIMIEKGSVAHEYVPFGVYSNIKVYDNILSNNKYNKYIKLDNGTELCKIGDYRDYFRKNTEKNLLKNILVNQTTSNVSFINNEGGIVSTSGTASADIYKTINEVSLKPGTYTLSGCPSGGSNRNYKLSIYNATTSTGIGSDYGEGFTFTAVEGNLYRIQIVIYNGQNTNNLLFKPQLELGSIKTDYEPYGKGWYLHKEIGNIPSYNGETITTSYISTTGGLDTGANVYYVLLTPIDTPITNQSVIDSLESIVKSYEDETHIVSVDDVPMYLDVSAVSKYNLQN